MALYALGALAFIAVAIGMLRNPEAELIVRVASYLIIAGFGLSAFVSVKEMVRPRIGLRLDEAGIHSSQALGGNAFDLPWSELAAVRVVTIRREPMVVFEAHDPEWGMDQVSPAVRAMRKANAALVGSWMSVPPRMFGATAEGMVGDVDRYYRSVIGAPVEYPRLS